MSHFFQKPENALKRAKELMSIPNVDAGVLKRTKRSALEILHDALIAKKNRTWQPTHEELMILYIDICLELQLGRIAKDGLHQYRNLSIQHNPASLETVIVYFVNTAERKLAEAKRESNEMIILAAAKVDLEAAQTPEAVMLSTTTAEGSSDRTDREVVVPWLRFMWETYRTVLDILKSNTKLETLYKTIAMKAFDFCEEYTRKIEFRRVCEILRNHLGSLQKHVIAPTTQSSRQMRSWDGFTLESVELLLEIRYRQLQVATDLELFSEAFRTIDDINTIMGLVEQVPRLELMVTYYEKLAQIFLVSKNYLFHAYALYKWYSLRVGGLSGLDGGASLASIPSQVKEEDQKNMATRVVLASLSIPLVEFESSAPVFDEDASSKTAESSASREKNARMAALLGFATTPTRAKLLDEIESADIITKATSEVSTLYNYLERQEVDPLQIVKQVQPYLATLRSLESVQSYVNSVERLLVRRVLFQLTRVYSSVTIAHLRSLFVGLDVTYQEIEQLIVRSRSLSTVAHASVPSLSSTYLNKSGNNYQNSNVETSTASDTSSALRTKIRIDHVQQCIRFSEAVELEANPAQLTLLGERLNRVLNKVYPDEKENAVAAKRVKAFEQTRAQLKNTRTEMLERREIIERKKEELERLQQEKLKTLEKKRLEYEQMRQQMEQERLQQEARRREMEKKQKIKDEIALKETKQMLDKLGRKDLEGLDLENIDRDQILNEAKEKAQKAKEEAQRKLRDNARRLDYIIRATREVEQPILQKQAAKAKEDAKLKHETEVAETLKAAKEAYEFSVKEKTRLSLALTVTAEFVEAHAARRKELYKKEAAEHKKKVTLERLDKRVGNAKRRYEDEQERLREIKEEEERRIREEEEELERERQAEIEETLRREEEEEQERLRLEAEAKEEAATREREERAREQEREPSRFGSSGGAYRPMSARGSEREDGEWTSVSRTASTRAAAPEGRWERRGPSIRGERESEGAGSSFREGSRFGDREGGLRRGFGGDRDGEREGGLRRGFGGDRDGEREGGLRRGFGGDRDGERDGGLRRGLGGDRDGEREGGLRRGFGGDRDGDREGGLRRGFGGDRDGEREGGLRRGFGGDREESRGGWNRGGERTESSSFRRGGEREGGEGEDRFFGRSSREGAYRPPQRDGEARPARDSARAPESGRWR